MKPGRRAWFKLWAYKTIHGTTFRELEPDERAVWFGFLCLAADSPISGIICAAENVPFTDEQVSKLLNISPKLLRRATEKMVKVGKIEVNSDGIRVINWPHYQGDYVRKQNEREGGRVTNVTPNPAVTNVTDRGRGRGERGEEERDPPTTTLTDADFARLQAHYEKAYSVALTPTQANALAELAEEFSLDDVLAAITEAARCSKNDTRYIAAIVRCWAVEGRQPTKGAEHEKGRGNSDEAALERWCTDNWELLGFASQADAERAAVAGN